MCYARDHSLADPPHDVELPANRQVLLAQRKLSDKDAEEGSPDRLGDTLAESDAMATPPLAEPSKPEVATTALVPAALRQYERSVPATQPAWRPTPPPEPPAVSAAAQASGTVILDVEQGGIVVPSFLGKSVRAAIELAQSSGLDLDAEGSGLAVVQSPAAGSHVVAGSRVVVRFGR